MRLRPLAQTGLSVSTIGMGCWPISGMTSLGVSAEDSLRTLRAAYEAGVNCFDSAFGYGLNGESDKLIAKALGKERDQIVLCSKVGIHFLPDRTMVKDGSPLKIRKECDETLRRLRTDRVDILYLHAPDPKTPIEETAGAMRKLQQAGKTLAVGLSNATRDELERFHRICPLSAYQPCYNMLQREIEASQLPWCRKHGVAVLIYWPLLKGLLAGKLSRHHVFDARDGRKKYPMFQGEEWSRNQDLLDDLRTIARYTGRSVVELVLAWTIDQPGITVALCGAKRPEQIQESARAGDWRLTPDLRARVDEALARRGPAVTKTAV